MTNSLSNYPDIISVALIPMIIAIFALGFPLLIQTITRIDDKYKSTILISTFINEKICKWFLWVLFSAIASYVIWFCKSLPLVNLGWLIDNFVLIFAAFSTTILIVKTFRIVDLIHIYYVPELLLNRLIKAYNKTNKQRKKTLYFEGISKILFYSINETDETLARTLLDFYYDAFIGFRKGKEGQPIEYPQEFYNNVFEANELLCNRKRKTVSYFNDSTLFELFLDQYQKTVISPKTYNFLWLLIVQSISYDKTDFILSYWRKAHQLFSLFMPKIYPEYNSTINIKNQVEIDKREKECNDFLEFHYALGGLLMYKQQYETIKELMNFTQSQPPKYVLVPERMQQVIEWYMQIDRWEYHNPVYYEQKYQFPDIYGVNADGTIRMWIKRYLAVIFIRQYTLHKYYIHSNPLTLPQPPENLSELNRWKGQLSSLDFFVNDYLSQRDVLEGLGLGQFSNPNWFEENNKTNPSVLIENFKKEIEDKFNHVKKEQSIDSDKEQKFKEKTIEYLRPILEKYSNLFKNKQIGNDYQVHYIKGQYYILEKTAFAENQDMSYINSDSITAESVAKQLQYYALNTFILMSPLKYFLIEKDVFVAIDKLKIDSENFVIISVGLNIDYFSYLQIDGLQKDNDKWSYKGMEIIEINNYMNELVSQSLFILKKEDLPNMVCNEINNQFIEKYHLEKIDDTYNIYTGLNDLNKLGNEIIKQAAEKDNNQTDLSNSVLACVDINIEIQYKQRVQCVQFKAFSQFDDRGKSNKIEDIKVDW
jgi:hypothetical protein